MDTNHIHNHLVVNSVSCVDGKKLHQSADDLLAHRQANDEICLAHGLNILEQPEIGTEESDVLPVLSPSDLIALAFHALDEFIWTPGVLQHVIDSLGQRPTPSGWSWPNGSSRALRW